MKKLFFALSLFAMSMAYADDDNDEAPPSNSPESGDLARGGFREGRGPDGPGGSYGRGQYRQNNQQQQYRESEMDPAIRQQRQLNKQQENLENPPPPPPP